MHQPRVPPLEETLETTEVTKASDEPMEEGDDKEPKLKEWIARSITHDTSPECHFHEELDYLLYHVFWSKWLVNRVPLHGLLA